MNTENKIIIPIELYSSKNSRRIFRANNGRTVVAKSKQAMKNEHDLMFILPARKSEFLAMLRNQPKPYRVHFKIFRKTARRFDYTNIAQNLCDCMVKAGWLADDNADELLPIFEQYEVDKVNPRVEIFIGA